MGDWGLEWAVGQVRRMRQHGVVWVKRWGGMGEAMGWCGRQDRTVCGGGMVWCGREEMYWLEGEGEVTGSGLGSAGVG